MDTFKIPFEDCPDCSSTELREVPSDGTGDKYFFRVVSTCRKHGVRAMRTYDVVYNASGEEIGYGYAPKVVCEYEGGTW